LEEAAVGGLDNAVELYILRVLLETALKGKALL
jgi:hypothetical protein